MGWIYLLLVVVLGTALWPVARWTLAEDGNARVMGFWISLTACDISLIALLFRNALHFVPTLWLAALAFGVAYAVGFTIIIVRCLQIGPTGPTVTLNNSAMICGVLYSVVWLDPHLPNFWVITGIIGVFAALGFIGYGGNAGINNSQKSWLGLVLLGSAFSGASFVVQTYVGVRHAGVDNSLLFTCVGFGTAAAILLVAVAHEPMVLLRRKRELSGGVVLGVSNTIAMALTMLAFSKVGGEIVLPVSVTTPMVLVLIIGVLAYKEHLSRLTWVGCLLAILSVAAMGYGSSVEQKATVENMILKSVFNGNFR